MKTKKIIIATFILTISLAINIHSEDKYQIGIADSLVAKLDTARAFSKRGDIVNAESLIRSIISIDSSYYRAHYNLALIYYKKGDLDTAITLFHKAIEVKDRENIEEYSIYNSLGYSYFVNGDYKNAEIYLLRSFENKDKLSNSLVKKVYNNLGTLYMNTGKFDEAKKYLLKAKNDFSSNLAEKNLETINKTEIKMQSLKNEL